MVGGGWEEGGGGWWVVGGRDTDKQRKCTEAASKHELIASASARDEPINGPGGNN